MSDRLKRVRPLLEIVILAAVYFAAARGGLAMDAVSGFATLVWAPSGLALAALLLLGYRVWPGIAIGAFAANMFAGAPVAVALGIAAGNTLEALVGATLLRRVSGFRPSLDRVRDVIALVGFAAALSTAVSATIGVASLYAGGILAPGAGLDTWRAWWVGDLIGDLLVAPMVLVWSGRIRVPGGARLAEAAAVGAASIIVSAIVFAPASPQLGALAHAYFFFPVLIWAALRFGQRGAVSSAFLVSVIAIWATVLGRGPFARPVLHERLFALQTFLAVAALTFLVLGAISDERGRATAKLEQALTDAREARDTAAAANKSKADFLAVMSHELRTPLNAICGFADLLTMGVHGPLNPRQRHAVERIQRNEAHLLALIDEVLGFARIDSERAPLDIRAVPVAEMFDEVESAIEPEAQRKTITLIRDLADGSLAALADPNRLRQIMLNVVGNAVKFTPPGGRVIMSARRDNGALRITVCDTGIGIPADKMARVFEPFFQVDAGSTREHGGVGLGLSIARELARIMQGDVAVESEVGKGSTVSISIPAA